MSVSFDNQPVRRKSTPSIMFADFKSSPLHDLAKIAMPGVHTRVMHDGSVAKRKETMGMSFTQNVEEIDEEELVDVEGGSSSALLWAAFMACCCAAQYGWNNGNMNTAAPAMRQSIGIPVGSGDAGDNKWAFCIAVFCLGALAGCTIGSSLADTMGRRPSLLLNSVVYLFGGAMEAASAVDGLPPVTSMILGRAISGCACGWTTVVVPVYLGEISPPHLRGALGTGFQLTVVIAMLLAQVLGLPSILGNELWPYYMFGGVVAPFVALVLLQSKLVESPCWLAANTKDSLVGSEANKVLAKLRGEEEEDVLNELEAMRATSSSGGNGGAKADTGLFSDPRVRPGLIICIVCTLGQQFSGINNAFNYSTTFLTANGIDPGTVMVIAVAMNVGNVIISLVSAVLMDRLGRTPLLTMSAAVMAVSVVALTAALTNPGQVWTSPLAVISVVCFVAGFGIGTGPIPWLLPAEMLPADKCARGASFAATCNWSANFVVGLTFPTLSNVLSGYCFLPNAVILVFLIIFVKAKVPESRGKTVDKILEELGAAEPQDDYKRMA